ncbi:MAG TPA: hypothetical protein VF169_07515 [Albitalea sp.]|uniref:hypothetical protein n=1 Tax=Piscinibacter sp. TaxID=1903157 RepID=UPI002ED17CD5
MDKADWDYLCDRRGDIRLRALANRMYQQERQRIFETREGLVKVASLVAGSVALANVTRPDVIRWSAAVIFAGTAMALVFAWGSKARDAARRSAEWANLEKEMEEAGERTFTEPQLAVWAGKCNGLEAGEPAMHPGLWERCYLRACEALGSKPKTPGRWWDRVRPAIVIH